MLFHKIHAQFNMVRCMLGPGAFRVMFLLDHSCIMHKGTEYSEEHLSFVEVFTAQVGAMYKAGHGKKGVSNVTVVMVGSIAPFIAGQFSFIKFLGETKGLLEGSNAKLR